ncbi:flagellar hook protein FlgE [Pseudorhizobium flavum]|uniref:Flagellar hook protein FlgE n=1 Tax=Pseudorhizobium flavum TaxID=1335061 RepID=A0A7W9Z243_9HYPH|nr:flagellar hook protein FlgE [Pseudorhizobium flavum]MBB6182144.1 flagellar hook protein FlgE [Pseudorhizobium flavum]CAD6631978.1 flagellar hook protein FlgE [Pseudorhizobium flavum]
MSIFGTMRTAVSGMNGQANRLGTVGDNIANANTVGYKGASTSFTSLILPSSEGSYNSGGVETKVRYSISQEGGYSATTSLTDLSIKGNGFFIVKAEGGSPVLTRAGNFVPDGDGNLVNAAGFALMGYSYNAGAPAVVVNGFDGLVPVNVKQQGLSAQASTSGYFQGNINAGAPVVAAADLPSANADPGADNTFKTSMVGYDTLGNVVQYDYYFTKTAEGDPSVPTESEWEVAIYRNADAATGGTSSFPYTSGPIATGTLMFDSYGKLTESGTVTPTITLDMDDPVTGQTIEMDFGGLIQLGAQSSGEGKLDGLAASELKGVNIDKDGTVYAQYADGSLKPLYRIPLATVASPDLLTPGSGNVYTANTESGVTVTGFAQTNGLGYIQSGSLESSNVDIAEELTEMIEAQRVYTANSKVFQTGSDLMEVLVNLKR